MIFELPMFTLIHVVISLLGVVAGLVVVGGLMTGARLDGWTAFFLATTILTSVTGFRFPFTEVSPPLVVGALSLAVLAVCLAARYLKQLVGAWRATYVITAVMALYLNFLVLVVQLFAKTPQLARLAPTQQEAPFVVTQALVFALFLWLGWTALRGFRVGKAGR
jgi:hypothetical protein